MGEVKLFGIRHHGAGSSRNLIGALKLFAPDLLLVECPADAESCYTYLALDLVSPPAAIMIYNPKDLNQFAYYPFTIFSPEWQAFQYALKNRISVRFFDLPQNQSFLISDQVTSPKKEEGFTHDPFGYLAAIAGFDDPERWWEEYIEQQREAPEIFETILDLMIELRGADLTEKKSNLIREAFMRQQIRLAIKDSFDRIAVVCGAWHTPTLVDLKKTSANEDAAMLKNLKKTPAAYTWVPWSYSRIARHTGYSAGVISPYWYEVLFTDQDTAVARWMSRASGILHDLGHLVSPAQTIESTKLAISLAYLRKKSIPGIQELFDAVSTVQARGNEEIVDHLKVKLLEGEKIGFVSEQVPAVPLLRDLEDQLKKVKLHVDWKVEGLIEKHFDLRKPLNLQASRLLHRLALLGIHWGSPKDPEHQTLGTFHEYWDLEWHPEYELQIIEASLWGNTVETAAYQFVIEQLEKDAVFEKLGHLLYQVMHAHLPGLVTPVSQKIRDLGNLTDDVVGLMKIIPPLIWSMRYGTTARIDTGSIRDLIDQLYPRLCILLPAKTQDISEEVASEIFTSMNQLHQATQLLEDMQHQLLWNAALHQISKFNEANALLKGNSLRLLLIGLAISEDALYKLVRYNLSSLHDPFYPCYFLEGMFYGGGWLIIHKPILRQIIDQWIITLDSDIFNSYLPVLRRTFSTFSMEEKETIYNLLFSGRFVEESATIINEKRKATILQGTNKLFKAN